MLKALRDDLQSCCRRPEGLHPLVDAQQPTFEERIRDPKLPQSAYDVRFQALMQFGADESDEAVPVCERSLLLSALAGYDIGIPNQPVGCARLAPVQQARVIVEACILDVHAMLAGPALPVCSVQKEFNGFILVTGTGKVVRQTAVSILDGLKQKVQGMVC